jgi:hypothetical protein
MSIEKNNIFNNTVKSDVEPVNNTEQAWLMNSQDEKEFLDDLAIKEIDLICNQLETFAVSNPKMAVRGYEHLVEKYPENPQKKVWENRINELMSRK